MELAKFRTLKSMQSSALVKIWTLKSIRRKPFTKILTMKRKRSWKSLEIWSICQSLKFASYTKYDYS